MAFRIDHDEPLGDGLRRVALERLDDAVERLDGLPATDDVETAVHEIRKRAKEVRGLLRLVEPHLGEDFRPLDRKVRDAGRELSALRDAHAVAATFDDLRRAAGPAGEGPELDTVARVQARRAEAQAAAATGEAADHVEGARRRLAKVRRRVAAWSLPSGVAAVQPGLTQTYRSGRRALSAAAAGPSNERMHEWRKSTKHLWYQLRLLENAAPSILGPLADRFDDLAEALGDDHDLATLVGILEAEPASFGGGAVVAPAVDLARRRQGELRSRAFGLGARLYAEKPKAFASRVASYVAIAEDMGRERRVGGITEVAGVDDDRRGGIVERERTFVVRERPPLGVGQRIRQGYLAVDGKVSVRVRDAAGDEPTLTVKAGSGSTRTELEWTIPRIALDALWPVAESRCVVKTRHRVPLGPATAEVDVFDGALEGHCLVDVEFADDEAMAAFEPPPWFAAEVTDDARFSNAQLATHGWPAD